MTLLDAAWKIFNAALSAGDPYRCVRENLELKDNTLFLKNHRVSFTLSSINKIYIIGAGKATASMARAVEDIFTQSEKSISGIISVKYGHNLPLSSIEVVEAGHPYPDKNGMAVSQSILSLLKNAGPDDLVISLISGGGSALLPFPVPSIKLADIITTTKLLLACGADISEINTIRKHISQIKGGKLARAAYPAPVINLLLSDVLGDKIDVIASGPFVPDQSTYQDANKVLKKYDLLEKIPKSVKKYLKSGLHTSELDTPKQGDKVFNNVFTTIIGSNRLALDAASREAEYLRFNTLILSSCIRGEARELGTFLASIAQEIVERKCPLSPPCCLLLGGETTVTLRGKGKGGRSQECVLASLKHIAKLSHVLIFCAGTDGTDGPTDAAGAFCTGQSLARGIKLGLDAEEALQNNDSYNYFKKLGNLIITGPTGTNLMDIYMLLVGINHE